MEVPAECGVSTMPDGTYLFVVERYAADLLPALDRLEAEVFGS